ncbi:hypothetical protein POM88_027205 [Heracleum sosnowskyi]|uniref:Protochlorophyllide reductase n=1 Tax=Heracleum sosnowskyi TaxID=360622 RepID=A0AAD8MP98_9APIA|nr:hypothetical protein POM88_027205 [Heracleum sosnowskyi]
MFLDALRFFCIYLYLYSEIFRRMKREICLLRRLKSLKRIKGCHLILRGKTNVSLKDTSLFGVSFTDSLKTDFSSLRTKKGCSQISQAGAIRSQSVVTAPSVNRATGEGKKTLRKGSVIIIGASSGLGLATAKALAETGKWHVIMACRDFLKAERAAKSAGMPKENLFSNFTPALINDKEREKGN